MVKHSSLLLKAERRKNRTYAVKVLPKRILRPVKLQSGALCKLGSVAAPAGYLACLVPFCRWVGVAFEAAAPL